MESEVSGDPAGYALAFEEGRAAVAEQASSLREMRDRTASLVSMAGLIAGLGASLILDDGRGARLDGPGVVAAIVAASAFVVIVVAAVKIWGPLTGNFVRDSAVIVGSYVDGDRPASLPEIHRALAIHLGNDAQQNREAIGIRLDWFAWALRAFLALVAGLAVMILDVAR